MNHHTLSARRRIATAAALLSLSFAAHAEVSSKVDLAITDLNYRLVDLTPDDGQAPGLTVFDEFVSFGAGVTGGARQGLSASVNPLPLASRKADAGGGNFAEVGPHILGAHVQAEGPYRLPSGFEIQQYVYDFVDSRSAGVQIWDSEDREGPQGLLLAPHTKLVFEGTATLSSYASASALLGADGKPVTTPYLHQVDSHGVIYLKLDTGFDDAVWSAETGAGASYTLTKDGVGVASAPGSDSKTLPFLLTLSNNTDKPLGAYFDWQIASYSSATAVTPTAVPEPEAWALMLAGLLVVPAAMRRPLARRRAQKPQR